MSRFRGCLSLFGSQAFGKERLSLRPVQFPCLRFVWVVQSGCRRFRLGRCAILPTRKAG